MFSTIRTFINGEECPVKVCSYHTSNGRVCSLDFGTNVSISCSLDQLLALSDLLTHSAQEINFDVIDPAGSGYLIHVSTTLPR